MFRPALCPTAGGRTSPALQVPGLGDGLSCRCPSEEGPDRTSRTNPRLAGLGVKGRGMGFPWGGSASTHRDLAAPCAEGRGWESQFPRPGTRGWKLLEGGDGRGCRTAIRSLLKSQSVPREPSRSPGSQSKQAQNAEVIYPGSRSRQIRYTPELQKSGSRHGGGGGGQQLPEVPMCHYRVPAGVWLLS